MNVWHEFHYCGDMEFILAQLSILIWLSLISFILAKFPVQRLNILISGGSGNGTFSSQRGSSNIACLLSLCKASPIFLQQHSLAAAMANIIKCPVNTHTHTHNQPHLPSLYCCSLPLLFLPDYHSVAVHEGKKVHWSAKVSSHFTGWVCAVLLSCPWMGIAHFTWQTSGKPHWRGTERGSQRRSQGSGQGLAGGR